MNAGIYELSMKQYLADPCDKPSFTSTAAKAIVNQSPLHAWHSHSRLNGDFKETHKKTFDLGSAVHAMFLEGDESSLVVIDANSFQTKAAREERDEAYAAGLTPLLGKHYHKARVVANAAQKAWHACEEMGPLDDYEAERSLLWQEPGGWWCRSRPDLMTKDRKVCVNLKTTATNAEPASYGHGYLINGSAQIQAYHHIHGIEMLTGVRPKYVWMVQEVDPPYGCSFIGMNPYLLVFAEQQWTFALIKWRECMISGEWPSYPNRVAWMDAPVWAVKRFCERPEVADVLDVCDLMEKHGDLLK